MREALQLEQNAYCTLGQLVRPPCLATLAHRVIIPHVLMVLSVAIVWLQAGLGCYLCWLAARACAAARKISNTSRPTPWWRLHCPHWCVDHLQLDAVVWPTQWNCHFFMLSSSPPRCSSVCSWRKSCHVNMGQRQGTHCDGVVASPRSNQIMIKKNLLHLVSYIIYVYYLVKEHKTHLDAASSYRMRMASRLQRAGNQVQVHQVTKISLY
jgi:hypothetical protein